MTISHNAMKKSQVDLLRSVASHMKDFDAVENSDETCQQNLVHQLVNGIASVSRTIGEKISVACHPVDVWPVTSREAGQHKPTTKLEYGEFPELLKEFFSSQGSTDAFKGLDKWLAGLRQLMTGYGIQHPGDRTAQWIHELGLAVEGLRQVLFVRREQLVTPLIEPQATGQGGTLGTPKPDIQAQLIMSKKSWDILRDDAARMDPDGERLGC